MVQGGIEGDGAGPGGADQPGRGVGQSDPGLSAGLIHGVQCRHLKPGRARIDRENPYTGIGFGVNVVPPGTDTVQHKGLLTGQ